MEVTGYIIDEYKRMFPRDIGHIKKIDRISECSIRVELDNDDVYIYNSVTKALTNYNSLCFDSSMTQEDWMWIFARRLSAKCQERGIRYDELADLTGMSERTIVRYMTGVAQPSAYNVTKIALALGCSASDIMPIS